MFKDFSSESKEEMLRITREMTRDKRYFLSVERKRSAEITFGFHSYVGKESSSLDEISIEQI